MNYDNTKNYDNTNTGVLFKTDPKKKKNENSPDYIGSLNVEGKEWTIFGLKKISKKNESFLRLSIVESKPKPNADDDLPF